MRLIQLCAAGCVATALGTWAAQKAFHAWVNKAYEDPVGDLTYPQDLRTEKIRYIAGIRTGRIKDQNGGTS